MMNKQKSKNIDNFSEVEDFSTSEYIISFLLDESFSYIHGAARYAVAGIIFSQKLNNIDIVDSKWKTPEISNSIDEWLLNKQEILSNASKSETIDLLSHAWESSVNESLESNIKLSKTTQLEDTCNVIGHIINLNICLEGCLNKHIFYLYKSHQLEAKYYTSIDKSDLMAKILFCFKEKILTKEIKIDRIKQLISMRNKAVHYRVDSYKSLQPSLEDVICIWKQIQELFYHIQGEPDKINLENHVNYFIEKWIN